MEQVHQIKHIMPLFHNIPIFQIAQKHSYATKENVEKDI